MWRLIPFIAAVPMVAQPPTFSDLVDTAVRRSGFWEAPVDLDETATPFPERIKGLIINIEILIEEKAGVRTVSSVASLAMELEHPAVQQCGGRLQMTESNQLTLLSGGCGFRLHLEARLEPDGQRINGRVVSDRGKSIEVSFVRLPFHQAAGREFQGIWIGSASDRVVAFRISYSLVGLAMVMQDFLWKLSSDRRVARLGEFWWGNEHDHHLDAGASRPAFNDTFFSASVVEAGSGLLAVRCQARMGLLCPVTFNRAEDEVALASALRRMAQD